MRSKGMMAIMWKMFGWLAKAVASALIVSFLAIWTTGYVVNSYIETLLKQYNLPLETQPFALQGVWGALWGADPVNQGSAAEGNAGSSSAVSGIAGNSAGGAARDGSGGTGNAGDEEAAGRRGMQSADSAGSAGRAGGDDGREAAGDDGGTAKDEGDGAEGEASGRSANGDARSGADDASGGTDGASGDADDMSGAVGDADAGLEDAPVTGSGAGEGSRAQGGAQSETVVTTDQLLDARERMAEEDRNKLFAILVSKLPAEEWQTISAYVEDGLTGTELTNVQQIVAQYLTDAEYDELMEILRKY